MTIYYACVCVINIWHNRTHGFCLSPSPPSKSFDLPAFFTIAHFLHYALCFTECSVGLLSASAFHDDDDGPLESIQDPRAPSPFRKSNRKCPPLPHRKHPFHSVQVRVIRSRICDRNLIRWHMDFWLAKAFLANNNNNKNTVINKKIKKNRSNSLAEIQKRAFTK